MTSIGRRTDARESELLVRRCREGSGRGSEGTVDLMQGSDEVGREMIDRSVISKSGRIAFELCPD